MATYIPAITIPAKFFESPAAAILLPITLGAAVGYATRPKETQKTYMALKQPPFRPPPYVFGPAWTVLYGLMGYGAFRSWTVGMATKIPTVVEATRRSATVYTVQLALNLIWMPLFFGVNRPVEATADILALTGTVGYLAYLWADIDKVAAWCMAPYLGWLGFATYLCIGTSYLNNWNLNPNSKTKTEKSVEESKKEE